MEFSSSLLRLTSMCKPFRRRYQTIFVPLCMRKRVDHEGSFAGLRWLSDSQPQIRNHRETEKAAAVGVNIEIKVWSRSLAFKYFMSEKAHGATTQLRQMTCVRLGCKHTWESSRATKSAAESFLSPFLFSPPKSTVLLLHFFSSLQLFFLPAQC